MKLKFFLLFFIIVNTTLLAQETSAISERTLTKDEALADFDLAIEGLTSIHPSAYSFTEKDSLESLVNNYREEIYNDISEINLHLLLRKVVKHIACGHTIVRPSEKWYDSLKAPKLVPFDIILSEDKIFIKEAYKGDSILIPGTEIIAIDNRHFSDIVKDMKSIQERDGFSDSFVKSKLEKLFRTYYLFLYGQNECYDILFRNIEGNEEMISVNGGGAHSGKGENIEKSKTYISELKTKKASFTITADNPNLGILDIDNFHHRGYKKFYKKVFKEIKKKNIENLVLDLRNNGGGYFPSGNHLLSYFLDTTIVMNFNRPKGKTMKSSHLKMNFISKMTRFLFNLMPDKDKKDPKRNYAIKYKSKKKNHFEGKLYVLINGGSFSLSSYTATMLKHKSDATFIGQEVGGGESGSNAILEYDLTLPESGIRIRIPYYFLDHKVSTTVEGRGVLPDYEIKYSLQETLQNEDKEMEKLMQLLK